ncbi:MAG: hypothetical protein M1838_003133 [Thelocarpon superellum]|nr:MAG: hypothetical protein M1838_003133 [Thelocarpon superellum]
MQTANGGDASRLFENVTYHIVRSDELPDDAAEQLVILLNELGANQEANESSGGKIHLEDVTHIISMTSDFPEYHAALDAFVSVVKPAWVTASVAKQRLAPMRPYSPDPRLFFSGVTLTCVDLPEGDKEAIIGGVLAMGGQYSASLTKMVTHIVALTEDNEKCQKAIIKALPCKTVLPHWFDDCLKLGKRIDEAPYLLPNPDLTTAAPHDPVAASRGSHLIGASSTRPDITSSSGPRQDLDVFERKKVMLSHDLELGSHLRGVIEDLVTDGRGSITGSVHTADVLICHYREGKDYEMASRAGKDVGNLSWLYYLIASNVWTSPFRRLLHYPVARHGISEFKDYRISVSNYEGEARLYLENLIVAAGGTFTKTLSPENTHLITARSQSEKCNAAREWNIHLVNHLWLEESYAKWDVQSLTNPRYNHFPARTNLGEVVGQTQVDRDVMKALFFPGDGSSPDAEGTEPSRAMHRKDENISSTLLANGGVSSSSPRHQTGLHSSSNLSDEARPKKARRQRLDEPGQFETPLASRMRVTGKENETPTTGSSRGAKDRAMARLHDLAPDIALYEKEKKRVGGVIWGGRRTAEASSDRSKRSFSHQSADDEDAMDVDDGREVKRPRTTKLPPPKMRLLLTGYQKWVGQPQTEEDDTKRLRELGILIVQDPSKCTHLAAPAIMRTQKFLLALAYAPVIISTEFVDECLEENEVVPDERFLLKDVKAEKRFGFRLKEAVQRARVNERSLLSGITIYCTEAVHGGFDTNKAIIEANGGHCVLFRPRRGIVSMRMEKEGGAGPSSDEDQPEAVYLLSSDTAEQREVAENFCQQATTQGMVPRVVKTEWLLDLAMSQEIKWDRSYALPATRA